MRAVVFESPGKINLREVPEPQLMNSTDAIVKLTTSAICGTDLHMVHGTIKDMMPGTILGHEGVGIVEKIGQGVRNLKEGDRVVISSTIGCGYCTYCRAGYYSQCDNANPNGKEAGTAFFGGPKSSGPYQGLQAEKARIPFANVNAVKIPKWISDEHGVLLSDVLPTGFFGAKLAEIKAGDIVVVLGCGPIGLSAIGSAFHLGAGRVIAIDHVPTRLERARSLGAEIINFDEEEPVKAVMDMTGGIGADRVIDAVGVEAERPRLGPASMMNEREMKHYEEEIEELMSETEQIPTHIEAPTLALHWGVSMLDKAGTLAIIGEYPEEIRFFPIGVAVNKNLTLNMGTCHHRKYIPQLIDLMGDKCFDFSQIISKIEPFSAALKAYEEFEQRRNGTLKVELRM